MKSGCSVFMVWQEILLFSQARDLKNCIQESRCSNSYRLQAITMIAGTVYSTEKMPILTISFSNLLVLVPVCFMALRMLKSEMNPATRKMVPRPR